MLRFIAATVLWGLRSQGFICYPRRCSRGKLPTRVHVSRGTAVRNNIRVLTWPVVVSVLFLLVIGIGVAAYMAFGPGVNLLGWTGSQPSDSEEATPAQEDPTEKTSPGPPPSTASVSPDSPPDPAFDKLLPELERRTENVNLLLPAKLLSVLKNVAVDRDHEGDGYGIAFFRKPPENVVEGWGGAEVYGTLRAAPEEKEVSNEYFEATSVETFEMPDGAEATLRRMEPLQEQRGTQGPFWEGKFREGNHAYTLILLDDTSRDMAAQVLSTIVEVPQEGRSGSTNPTGSEASVRRAVEDYYEAVDREDWDYTYDNLDSLTRRLFTKEEWEEKNQWFADNEQRKLSSVSVKVGSITEGGLAEVTVDRTFDDGSSLSRKTYFIQEHGSWKHRFTQKEKDIFMPGLPYEEFVEAQ